jgi:ubiquinone biosynthesis protein UbiJ
MEAIAQQHDEVGALRDRVALLEGKLNDLCKPKPGRPKRQVQ